MLYVLWVSIFAIQALHGHQVAFASANLGVASRRSEILSLPGWPEDQPLPSRMWSGYIPVDKDESKEEADRHLWYIMAESQSSSPDEDPVVVWLTGGPGCSSLDAFVYEHGPFRFNYSPLSPDANSSRPTSMEHKRRHRSRRLASAPQQQEGQAGPKAGSSGISTDHAGKISAEEQGGGIALAPNPYAWSKAATVVYVDSPVGTGMSYSRNSADYLGLNDERTTDDLVRFIGHLMSEFPELQQRDLYLAGESYAGVYVPLLASKLLRLRQDTLNGGDVGPDVSPPTINLKGIVVGNGVTDDVYDGNAQPEFAFGMSLIDPPTYQRLQSVCKGSYWNATPDGECNKLLKHSLYEPLSGLNPYDILEDCYSRRDPTLPTNRILAQGQHSQQSRDHRAPQHQSVSISNADSQQPASSGSQSSVARGSQIAGEVEGGQSQAGGHQHIARWNKRLRHVVACADRRIALEYLNRPNVREALHALPAADWDWQPCSDRIQYDEGPIHMLPTYRELLSQGLKVLVLSGDHDFVVPVTGTRAWVFDLMGQQAGDSWGPWMVGQQVAGFLARFESHKHFFFATIKGAGHMAPESRPKETLTLVTRFLYDEL